MEGTSARVVAVDASVLINLIHGNRLPLLGALRGVAFVAPDPLFQNGHYLDDVETKAQSDPSYYASHRWILQGTIEDRTRWKR